MFILVYMLCSFVTYTILNERLVLIDKTTGEKIEGTGVLKILHELVKICFSLSWIWSIPYLLITKEMS